MHNFANFREIMLFLEINLTSTLFRVYNTIDTYLYLVFTFRNL